MEIGLKLWSTNKNYVSSALDLYKSNYYNYIELYTVPNSYNETIDIWKKLSIPYIIHAPHFVNGMCLGYEENESKNRVLSEEAFRFADNLDADIVIYHGGINGTIEEVVRQIQMLHDRRLTIENLPHYALNNTGVCIGSSPEEINTILSETGCKFCLDIGHAICAANSFKQDKIKFLETFEKLDPSLYHLTDGGYDDILDTHKHIGEGNYPLRRILSFVDKNKKITVETEKDSHDTLYDFRKDIIQLRNIIQ